MATISDNLIALNNEKFALKEVFERNGVDMTGVPFTDYHNYVPSGGTEGPHEVRFFDIDGTPLKRQKVQTGFNASFPSPPTKEFLAFAGWTHTQEEISNIQYRPSERGETFMPGHIDVGATYTCNDDITHIFVKTSNGGGKLITIYYSKPFSNFTLNIDWGDGSDVDRVNVVNSIGTRAKTYASEGEFHIQIWTDDNVVYSLGNGTTSTQIVTNGNTIVEKVYIANNVLLKNYAFYGMSSLREVSLPPQGTINEFGTNIFQNNYDLPIIIIPRNYTTIPTAFAHSCTSLYHIVIPWTITNFSDNGLYLTPVLDRVVFPPGINYIVDSFFELGSTRELVSDTIVSVGPDGFNSYYLATKFNLAKRIDVGGGSFFANPYALDLTDLELNLLATTNNLAWANMLRGTLIIRSNAGVTVCPGISNHNNITKIIIGDNFTSLGGAITNKKVETYIFERTIPPSISSTGYISGLSKTASIYVPDIAVDLYKTATNWTAVANYIKPISQLPI